MDNAVTYDIDRDNRVLTLYIDGELSVVYEGARYFDPELLSPVTRVDPPAKVRLPDKVEGLTATVDELIVQVLA